MTLCVPSTVYCTLQSEHTIVVKKKEDKGVHCRKLSESTSISITESDYKDARKHEHTDDSLHFQREGTQVWGHYWTTRRLQSNGRQVSGSAPQIFLSWRLVLLLWDDESRRGSLHLRRSGKSNAMSTVSIARQNKKKSVNAPFCPVLHIQFPSVPLYKQRLGKQDFQLLIALPWHPKKQQPITLCKTACVFRPAGGDLSQIRVLLQCFPPPSFFFSTQIIDLLGPFMQQVS